MQETPNIGQAALEAVPHSDFPVRERSAKPDAEFRLLFSRKTYCDKYSSRIDGRELGMTVLIAGGGIGGLTLALSLHQIGVPVRVFESVPELKPIGVGINVLPHACRELIELGLLRPARRDRHPHLRARLLSPSTASRSGPSRAGSRPATSGRRFPSIAARCINMLLDAARERIGDDNIVTGHHLADGRKSPGGVRARFRSTRAAGDRPMRRRAPDRRRRHPFGDAREALSGLKARRSGTAASCGAASPRPSRS